jgi:hypothetical protein
MNYSPRHRKQSRRFLPHQLLVRLSAIFAVFGLALGTSLVAAPAASAGHNEPGVYIGSMGSDGSFTIDTYWWEDTHQVTNAKLVLELDGFETTLVYDFPAPPDLSIGGNNPCEPVTGSYRVFGGGERSYDLPLWNGYGDESFTADINAYGADNGWDWVVAGTDDDNPFVNWIEFTVQPNSTSVWEQSCGSEPPPVDEDDPPHEGGDVVSEQAKSGAPIAHANGQGKRFQVDE